MSNTPSAPQPGTTLAGKYLVEQVLGIGGMGVVVAARHLQLDQRVAIKYLLPEALRSVEVVERFAREARAAAKIRGEHVARVIDVGQFEDGAPFMVLEYLEGHDLAKHLEQHGPLPIEDAVRYLLETCEALAEAHVARIVHRDLKPSNLFLAEQPDKSVIIKVLDFGISKTGEGPSAALTKTSALMGTAYYMSPEQLTAPKGVDHRSDIWSLGVILYELLAGSPPFQGDSMPEILGAILTNQAEGVRTVRAEVPTALEAVIAKCMQTKAGDRFGSVAALAAALGPFAAPKDRISVDITARVLGEVTAAEPLPLASVKFTVALPYSARASSPMVSTGAAPSTAVSPVAPQPSPAATGPSAGALTSQGLATSSITPAAKRGSKAWIGAVAAVVVVVGGAAGFMVKKGHESGPPAAATGMVAAAPTEGTPSGATPPPRSAAAASPNAPGASTFTALEPASGAAAAPSAMAPANLAPPVGAGAARLGPTARPASSAPATAPSVVPSVEIAKAVASAPTPLVSAAPPAASAQPAPAASKNPLQMGIK